MTASPGSGGSILPAPRLHHIHPEYEAMVPVRRAEIREMADSVENLENPVEGMGAVALTSLGIGIGALSSLIALYATKTSGTRLVPAAVAALVAIMVIGLVLAALLWWFDRRMRQHVKSSRTRLAERIRTLDERASDATGAG
jgi:protein-S-isoprenylcysteine O-methyltransferase Ste14